MTARRHGHRAWRGRVTRGTFSRHELRGISTKRDQQVSVVVLTADLHKVVIGGKKGSIGAAGSRTHFSLAIAVWGVIICKRGLDAVLVGRNQRYVRARTTSSTGRVDERRLQKGTVFAVEVTTTCLKVSNSRKGTIACVRVTSEHVLSIVHERRRSISTLVYEFDKVGLGIGS
jgi:hypothetical protein